MSVNTETASAQGQTTVLEKEGVYASLFEKINLTPASSLGDINAFLDDAALSDAPAGERLTAAMQVFMDCIRKSGQPVEKLDKTLIDHHIAELDYAVLTLTVPARWKGPLPCARPAPMRKSCLSTGC